MEASGGKREDPCSWTCRGKRPPSGGGSRLLDYRRRLLSSRLGRPYFLKQQNESNVPVLFASCLADVRAQGTPSIVECLRSDNGTETSNRAHEKLDFAARGAAGSPWRSPRAHGRPLSEAQRRPRRHASESGPPCTRGECWTTIQQRHEAQLRELGAVAGAQTLP